MRDKNVLFIVQAAAIAAIYVVLTVVFSAISFGNVQLRFSEALTVLPWFTPAAIPGLFVGCLLGNLLGGAILPDIVFGSLTTLAAACLTWHFRNRSKFLAPVFPVAANTLVIPFVLYYGYAITIPIPVQMLTVGLGEVLSCGIVGMVLLLALEKYRNVLFSQNAA